VVIAELAKRGATIKAYDPVALTEAKRVMEGTKGLTFVDNQTKALEGSDALVIITEWKEFRSPDFDHIKASLKTPVIFDGRNLYDPQWVRSQGFEYLAIGR
jgi:UDPglucose 6-dehydrogenase